MIYEFNCEACNKQFEVSLPMAECKKPLSEPCPMCGVEGQIFRVFEAAGFQTNMINDKWKKAGSFTDTLKKIDKAAGSQSTIFK